MGGGLQYNSEYQPLTSVANAAKCRHWQTVVYGCTFMAYAMSHFSRKSYTNVKAQLREDAGFDTDLLSRIDTGFMFCYAVGSFFSGKLGDKYNPVTVTSVGLMGSGVMVILFVIGVIDKFCIKNYAAANVYFMVVWFTHGLFQSTGGPVNTAIMGQWFGKTNRGLIFGTWTCHQYIGNIIAAVVTTMVVSSGLTYWWAMVISGIANFGWGVFCWIVLPARPSEKDVIVPDKEVAKPVVASVNSEPVEEMEPISFADAFSIPAVSMYAFAFGFFKLVNYCLFFWLPFFLSQSFDTGTANMISTLYDVGMMPGGIIVGLVSDSLGGRRALVCVMFFSLMIPLFWIFSQYSDTLPVGVLLALLGLMGIFVGGPNNIISSAVAADLAEHPSLKGNSRALGTVTGIINGSGSVTSAIGLLFIGRIQATWGWAAVWYFLIACTVIGCSLLSPKVMKELYHHHEEEFTPAVSSTNGNNKKGYQTINGSDKA